jgi:2-amino-4-hydroxy-6-hydroxymethyldihydropteridine diphosphokinase
MVDLQSLVIQRLMRPGSKAIMTKGHRPKNVVAAASQPIAAKAVQAAQRDLRPRLRAMVTAFIALGANLGDAVAAIRQAVVTLNALPLSVVKKTSSLYKTAPLEMLPGHAPGGDYINAVLEMQTQLPAPTLLQHLQQIELATGRERPHINAPRTLDLDLLLYGDGRIDSVQLTVPHPRMWQRAFVLVPLSEIAPGLVSTAQLGVVKNQQIERVER